MKKMFKYASLLFVSGALLMTSCGKKDDDEAVTPVETTPTCDGGSVKTTNVTIDATAASYTKAFSQNINKCDGTSKIKLDIKAGGDMDYIYITKSEDNGAAVPLTSANIDAAHKSLKTGNGKDVTSGTVWSYELPSGSIPGFDLEIPVKVRSSASAVSDVYTIWITNGKGNFSATGKKTVVGPIVVSLNYKSNTAYISSGAAINMGDQTATPPSYLSTDGVIAAISGADLYTDLIGAEKIAALNSADINLVSIAGGIAYGNATSACTTYTGAKPYFVGVGLRKDLGTCLSNTEGTDQTKFAVYTGAKTFATMTGGDINALSTPTLDRVEVKEGGVYVFLTADGRLGVINAKNLVVAASGELKATVDVEVKVLASAK